MLLASRRLRGTFIPIHAAKRNKCTPQVVAGKERIEELVYRVEDAEGRLSDPDLQRVVRAEASRYADEHQDDGR